jgi:long-chain acyl-CoA synthetase
VESLETAMGNETSLALLRFNSASPDDVATLTYTRGAAGRDNGVKNTHQNWLAGAAFTVEYLGLTKQDILVLPLPLHQSLALRQMLAYVRAGARILLAPTLDQAVKFMKDQRPTALALQPGQVQPLLEKFSPAFQKLAASLRYVKIGSGPLEARKLDSLRRLLPRTLILLSRNPTEAQSGFLKARPGGSPNGSCPPAPALALRIADEHRVQAPPGQSDRIFLTGPGMSNAFWGQSDHEMAMLIMDGYCSGGRAIAGKPGRVTLLGHGQEMLRIRGRIVNPAEIEAVLRRHVGVAECAVTGLLDAAGGFETAIHAFVAPTAKGALLTEQDLKLYCRAHLQPYKVPARIHFQASLPNLRKAGSCAKLPKRRPRAR